MADDVPDIIVAFPISLWVRCERAAMPPTATVATMPILTIPLNVRSAKKILIQSHIILSSGALRRIVTVSPVTRHKLIPEGSTAASAVYGFTNVAITWM